MEIVLERIILFGLQIDKLKNFYLDNFGFLLIEEIRDEWVVLKAGHVEIALHKIGQEHKAGEIFKVYSNSKLVFKINGDLHFFRQKLLAGGVSVQDVKSFPGINSLFCEGEDPEGNIFQLEQRPE